MRSISKNPRETRQRDYDFSPSTVGRRYSARLEEIWKNHSVDPRSADFSRHGLNREDPKVAKERKEDLSRKKG